jgi:hypothetical protein
MKSSKVGRVIISENKGRVYHKNGPYPEIGVRDHAQRCRWQLRERAFMVWGWQLHKMNCRESP